MKKILLIALAVVAAVIGKKKFDQSRSEKAVWHSVTDSVA
ncbi:DLW-39 family protein [Nocardioides yefusunii]|uniref:DLW-39 family protein n=1 Tax=Nocardioides yefusunii TaxID=2500546 RepID=A0ABW1QZ81_9ACTN|nr:DLW-39 family protein [Nocardioides yefusunii]